MRRIIISEYLEFLFMTSMLLQVSIKSKRRLWSQKRETAAALQFLKLQIATTAVSFFKVIVTIHFYISRLLYIGYSGFFFRYAKRFLPMADVGINGQRNNDAPSLQKVQTE